MRGWPALLAVAVVAAGCTAEPSAPAVDEGLQRDLERLGITYYLPAIDNGRLEDVRFDEEVGGPLLSYLTIEGDFDGYQVAQIPTPPKTTVSVCSLNSPPFTVSRCDEDAGWAWNSLENSLSVSVVRGGTLLNVSTVVRDDAQPRRIVAALLAAPEISPEDLARE